MKPITDAQAHTEQFWLNFLWLHLYTVEVNNIEQYLFYTT